jgi:hypothetical protein
MRGRAETVATKSKNAAEPDAVALMREVVQDAEKLIGQQIELLRSGCVRR